RGRPPYSSPFSRLFPIPLLPTLLVPVPLLPFLLGRGGVRCHAVHYAVSGAVHSDRKGTPSPR
ncbi:MAG TPA: hypothetical protein VMT69_05740, partial [Kineosporiaceae bacterium]|nr:hypothetical protein [Kineosporiaceae bacterium]